jgi:hypothetical protein
VHVVSVTLAYYCCMYLCCSCYITHAGKVANWAEGARLPTADDVPQLQAVLPVGHYWESIAGTDCDGFIKQSGKQLVKMSTTLLKTRWRSVAAHCSLCLATFVVSCCTLITLSYIKWDSEPSETVFVLYLPSSAAVCAL